MYVPLILSSTSRVRFRGRESSPWKTARIGRSDNADDAHARRGVLLGVRSPRSSSSSSSGSKSSGSKSGDDGDDDDSSSSSSSSSSKKSGSSSSKSGSSSSSSKKTTTVKVSGSTVGLSSAASYGTGGGSAITIPKGDFFAGRTAGGGVRSQVYGTRTYGSGYPGIAGRGVAGRNFPFVFWPVAWQNPGYGSGYLYDSEEYGDATNSSRPGGSLAQATFETDGSNNTFVVVADNNTVASLITAVSENCTLSASSSTAPTPYNTTLYPEEVIAYYRASSVSLLLEGYNDTAALSSDTNATDVPLPGWVNTTFLDCLNYTIGESVILFSTSDAQSASFAMMARDASTLGLLNLVGVLLCLHILFRV